MLEAVLPFIRNIALARLVSPDEFGKAISLSVVIGFVEVLTDFGLPVFAVRKSSTSPTWLMMGTLQSLALVRAALLGLMLVAFAPWIPKLFGAEGFFTTYALLGVVVVIRGFENLGVKEVMRRYVFWREATVLASGQALGAIVTVVSAWFDYGFACMLHGMLATALTTVLLSHLLSPTPFRLTWNTEAAQEVARFGRPLLVNGLAVSCTLGDRLLVGSMLGPAQLALYNVAYGTATLPRTVAARFLTSIFLPLFVENHERKRGSGLFDAWAWSLSVIAFMYGMAVSLAGDLVLAFVFGPTFQPSRLFMCLAGISICVKFLMLLPAPQALASGNTHFVAFGSILSALSVIPGIILLVWQRNITAFLLGLATAEFVVLIVYSRSAIREQAFTKTTTWLVIAAPLLLLASLALLTGLKPQMSFLSWFAACAVALGLSGTVYGLIFVRCRIGLRMLFTAHKT